MSEAIRVSKETGFSFLPGHVLLATGFVCSAFSGSSSTRVCSCTCGGSNFNATTADEAEAGHLKHLATVEGR